MNMNSNNMIKVWSLWPLRHYQRLCILPGESFPGLHLTHPAWAPACCRALQSLPQIRLRSPDWLSQSGVFHIFTPRRFFGCSYSAVLLNDEMLSNVFWSIWLNLSTLSAPAHPCIHPVASIRGEIINRCKCGTSVGSCTGGGSHNRTSTMFDRWGGGFRSRAPPTTPHPTHTDTRNTLPSLHLVDRGWFLFHQSQNFSFLKTYPTIDFGTPATFGISLIDFYPHYYLLHLLDHLLTLPTAPPESKQLSVLSQLVSSS